MKLNNFSDPSSYHNVENSTLKSYATRERAEKAVADKLAGWSEDNVSVTVLVTNRADGRFVPAIIAQGRDAMQLACWLATSGAGFMVFA